MVRWCVNGPVRTMTAATIAMEVAGWSGRRGELLVVALVGMTAASCGVDVYRHGEPGTERWQLNQRVG